MRWMSFLIGTDKNKESVAIKQAESREKISKQILNNISNFNKSNNKLKLHFKLNSSVNDGTCIIERALIKQSCWIYLKY